MTSFTTNKNLNKPGHNEDVDTWDVPINGNSDIIDACLGTTAIFNMTGLATKTLVAADYQCQTMKFTGTLNSGLVTILLPNGVSGEFTIIDATTATDATSQLGFGWTSGGTGVIVSHGATQMLTADGINLVWSLAAPQAMDGVTSLDLTGLTGTVTITEDRCRNQTWLLYGTLVNNNLILAFPKASVGCYAFINTWSAAGGSSNLILSVSGRASGSSPTITAGQTFMAAYYEVPAGGNVWNFTKI